MTDQKKSLFVFPCDFPVKIIGRNTTTLQDEIIAITGKHFPHTIIKDVMRCRTSKNNHYLSITITLYVYDQETLDIFYREVSQHPDIEMVL